MTVQSASVQDPAKRSRLVHSAAAVFSRVGFERASVEEIATGANVAKGTVYLYFDNKADLFLAVIFELRERIQAQSDGTASESADATLRRFIRTQLDIADRAPDLFRCYTSALFGVNREFQVAALGTFNSHTREVARTLRRLPGLQGRSGKSIEQRASLFISAVLATALVRGLNEKNGNRHDDEDALMALATDGDR